MKSFKTLLWLCFGLFTLSTIVFAQKYERKVVDVPTVDPTTIKIDGKMDEAAWAGAAHADLVTATGFQMFTFPYGRPGLTEPDYDELYGRMLWAKDTLYVFIHIDEFVNDSTDLYWDGKWTGDQLFVSLSSRLGVDMKGWYDGNSYAAPDGPYHFWIFGDKVTLNGGDLTSVPTEYQRFPADTLKRVFDPSKIARWATSINKTTGVWNVEMAIYNPNVNAGSRIGFNIGGSTGSTAAALADTDAYAYYCWQPSVVDSPFTQPKGVPIPDWGADPGYYNLATSMAWALAEMSSKSAVVGVSDASSTGLPTKFSLNQNYPNPFNPSTFITFDLSKQVRASLKVYNLLGQELATLVDDMLPAGRHQVKWNAAKYSSGVYFYQLRIEGNFLDAKKMLLVK